MSSMRINQNVPALNSHRNILINDRRLSQSLERLSSGMKINRAADAPASLVISEQLRSQVASLTQAVMNSETAVSMVQTTEASLDELNNLLVGIRQLAIHAANEGANDINMLEADQAEAVNALNSIDRIARTTQFGTKLLLDGSNGVGGTAVGENINFISAIEETKSAPYGGFEVFINRSATRSEIIGTKIFDEDVIRNGETISIMSEGKSISYTTESDDTQKMIQNKVQNLIDNGGLKLDVFFTEEGYMGVEHRDYGSKVNFEVVSSTDEILSKEGNIPLTVQNGLDVKGTINGELAHGEGQVLTGVKGTSIEGLSINYHGEVEEGDGRDVGRVLLKQNSLTFQIGANYGQTVQVALPNANTEFLGLNVQNESGFKSLREIDLRSAQGANDALLIIDNAIDKISSTRANLGAIQKNTLETNTRSLRVAKENLVQSESVIRDSDMAYEMSEYTRNQIMVQSSTAMLGQANQTPQNVLSLLK